MSCGSVFQSRGAERLKDPKDPREVPWWIDGQEGWRGGKQEEVLSVQEGVYVSGSLVRYEGARSCTWLPILASNCVGTLVVWKWVYNCCSHVE